MPTEYCGVADVAQCRPDRCTANGPACSGESLAVCNADGSGYSSVATDCSILGQVCTLTVGCADTAIDTLGGTELSSENPFSTLYLTSLEVLTPRTIVELEAYFAVPSDTEVTWLVYRSSTSSGYYAKMEEFTTIASGGAATYHASGSIGVPLQAGLFYALGAFVRGPHTDYRGASSGSLSFAAVVAASRAETQAIREQVWIETSFGSGSAVRVKTR